MPVTPPPSQKKMLGLGAVLVVAVLVFLVVVLQRQSEPPATNGVHDVPVSTFAPTPLEYQSFFGTVTAKTDTTIEVRHTILETSGQRTDITQTAEVNGKTLIQARRPDGAKFAFRAISFNDVTVGSSVIVAAAENLSGKTNFTATHIQRIDQ